jgi:hypothetical protein
MHTQVRLPAAFNPEHQWYQDVTNDKHREIGRRVIGSVMMQSLIARRAVL